MRSEVPGCKGACAAVTVTCLSLCHHRMTFDEFCHNFNHVVMCRQMKRMSCAVMHSEWAEPNKAGGCIEYMGTFLNNPQVT